MSRCVDDTWVILVVLVVSSYGCRAPAQTFLTSIRPGDCSPPPAEVARPYQERELGVQQCRAPAGWRLLVVASDANTWIEIAADTVSWSSEEAVVYESPFGLFPSIDGSTAVEWRSGRTGQVHAVVFRVTAGEEPDATKRVARFFVVRIEESSACLLDRVASLEAARELADGPKRCTPA